jgi:FtsZ-binding cell division protein ZapB
MSEFVWDAQVAEASHSEPESQSQPETQPDPEPQSEPEPQPPAAEPGNLTLSASDFSALEARILRAVETVRRERQARAAAEERAARLEAQLQEQSPVVEQLEKDLHALRAERDHVRERIERLLAQLDALEL